MNDLHLYRLTFPASLDEEAVVAVLGGLASDLYSRRAPRTTIELSVSAIQGRIHHHLVVAELIAETVLARLRAVTPGLRIELLEERERHSLPTLVSELRLTNLHRPLRTDRAASSSAALLMALSSVHRGERIEVSWLVSGARTPLPARQIPSRERGQRSLLDLLRPTPATWHAESEPVRQERDKQGQPLLLALPRIAVWTGNRGRAGQLLKPVLTALRSTTAPGVSLVPRRLPQAWMRRRFASRRVPRLGWPVTVNAAEAAALVGWPIDGPQIPGLSLSASRQLVPAPSISSNERDGVVVADATFPGAERPLVLQDQDRFLHTHVIGPIGAGKSTVLGNMILADAEHGHGVIVLDPARDLISDVLNRLPDHRHDDVIILDPADADYPVGLNPLERAGRSPDLVVEQLVGVIRSIFSAFWGPRSDDILRIALLSLAYASTTNQPYTLVDVPTILTNDAFRRRIVGQLSDPILRSSWASYENLGEAGRAQAIGPVLNKLRAFLLRPALRNILGQAQPGWSIEDVLRQQKILLVPLSAGELGEDAASLFGALLVARIWQAAQGRSAVPAAARRPVMLYLDEFQTLLRLPTKLGDVLAQARKLGLGLTLAHQHFGQLTPEIKSDVIANARSRIIFQLGIDDSRLLVKQLPQLTPEDLSSLPRYEVVAHLAAGGATVAPATGRTRPLPDSRGVSGQLIEASRQRYGRPVAEIEAELLERSQAIPAGWDLSEVLVGRKPVEDEQEDRRQQ